MLLCEKKFIGCICCNSKYESAYLREQRSNQMSHFRAQKMNVCCILLYVSTCSLSFSFFFFFDPRRIPAMIVHVPVAELLVAAHEAFSSVLCRSRLSSRPPLSNLIASMSRFDLIVSIFEIGFDCFDFRDRIWLLRFPRSDLIASFDNLIWILGFDPILVVVALWIWFLRRIHTRHRRRIHTWHRCRHHVTSVTVEQYNGQYLKSVNFVAKRHRLTNPSRRKNKEQQIPTNQNTKKNKNH